jgi:hypothetical protein
MGDRHRPRWINAKEPLQCTCCKESIKVGQKIYMVPDKKSVYCVQCSKGAMLETEVEEKIETEIENLK